MYPSNLGTSRVMEFSCYAIIYKGTLQSSPPNIACPQAISDLYPAILRLQSSSQVMNKSPMLLVAPTIETNETKNDPRVPYDPPSK